MYTLYLLISKTIYKEQTLWFQHKDAVIQKSQMDRVVEAEGNLASM